MPAPLDGGFCPDAAGGMSGVWPFSFGGIGSGLSAGFDDGGIGSSIGRTDGLSIGRSCCSPAGFPFGGDCCGLAESFAGDLLIGCDRSPVDC